MTASALGVLVLAGAASGVYLGQSAVDQINPIYFQGAAVHPRDRGAAVDEASLRGPRAPRFAELYGWEEGRSALGADCTDCAALSARDSHYDSGRHFAVIETGWREEPQTAEFVLVPDERSAQESAQEQAAAESPSPIAAYSSFQIEEKPEAEAEPVQIAVKE